MVRSISHQVDCGNHLLVQVSICNFLGLGRATLFRTLCEMDYCCLDSEFDTILFGIAELGTDEFGQRQSKPRR
jgi:hypothetical protein